MSLSVVVVIQEDPMKTHRAAEGLRIALGLSTGPNPLTIILLSHALSLLTDEAAEAVAADILEKYLPVVQELGIPIVIPEGSLARFPIDPEFAVRETSLSNIASLVSHADRVLVF